VVEMDGQGAGEGVVEKKECKYAKRGNRHTVLRAHDYIF
jgi:hypothetical protein